MKRFVILFFLLLLFNNISLYASTDDHSQYDILKQEFKTGPEVTKACLSCHVEAARQVHKTIHWTWVCPKSFDPVLGKAYVINNFCIALPSNEPRCTSCHAGYGWRDSTFNFSSERNVDCLVCHDNTGTYKKFPTDAGHPAYEEKKFSGKTYYPPDFNHIAQNVGKPTRHNCGVCHFYGGGGEGVKHADLDMTLENPNRKLDVHMDREGLNFNCSECHTTVDHDISGRCYSVPASQKRERALPFDTARLITCESCHSGAPHLYAKLNDHTDKVACQTCHIPYAAKEKYTKYWWDWSKAGEFDENGEPFKKKDEHGNVIYDTKKGEFKWEKKVVPEYFWFNGSADHFLLTDDIPDNSKPVKINSLNGSYHDPDSRIHPAKVHRGKQVYDPVYNKLVIPKLFGPKGSGAYWAEFDWKKSVQTGMDYVDLPFSGEVDFIETEMYWPITHMVSPAEDALECSDCHSDNGRLASLTGFYMPGRDDFSGLDFLGWLSVALSVIAVGGHATLRGISSRRRKRELEEDSGKESEGD